MREYLFINGKFEGLSHFVETKFDYLLFSTSLDHFENLEDVRNEIKKVIKKGGLAFFLVGLHDPEIVARYSMAYSFDKFDIFNKFKLFKHTIKLPFKLLKLYFLMLKRKILLRKSIPLDNLHYHYFTKEKLEAYMKSIGEIMDVRYIPLTNVVMYAVKVNI